MSKTNYLENKVLDHITGKTPYTAPTLYVGLFTAAPGETGGGTEVSGGSYARVATTSSSWDAASAGSVSNAAALLFPKATSSWGTVTHFGAFDASSSGNLLRYAALTTAQAVTANVIAQFDIGALTMTED